MGSSYTFVNTAALFFPTFCFCLGFFSIDTVAHAFLFAVLVFLMIVGLSKQTTYPHLNHYAIRASLFISTMFGIFIELLQHFFIYGRQGDIMDVLANTLGCLLGIIFLSGFISGSIDLYLLWLCCYGKQSCFILLFLLY
ncbi:VanZ family protein [Pontibacter rugosus]